MKAYTLCLLALAVLSSARPKPPGGEGPGPGHWRPHPPMQQHPGEPGSPATTAFPTMSYVAGGYGGAGTGTGGYQPPAPTSSAVKKTLYEETSEYSVGRGSSPNDLNPGDSGSQSLGSGPSSVAGSEPASTSTASTGTSSTGNTTTGGTISNGKISLPAGCESVNGIGFGWLPDYNGASLADDEAAVGNLHPCFAGYYAQTGLPVWNGGKQITDNLADAQSGGKPYPIFIASVMPQGTPFDQFTKGSTVVNEIASAMTTLTAAGLTVCLRFAHEMNWYDSEAGGYIYTGTTEDFSNAWGVVSAAVKDIDGVYMFWSPNYASSGQDLVNDGWYPTSAGSIVDIIGMDIYPAGGSSFASVYSDFCSNWPSIPFIIGETGSDNGGSTTDKHDWLEQLTAQADLQACPKYLGFSWFEYLKGGTDFRIATGGNTAAEGILD